MGKRRESGKGEKAGQGSRVREEEEETLAGAER